MCVSTHSRPKAAGITTKSFAVCTVCFNTQPPEGGWSVWDVDRLGAVEFQHTAARRRLVTCNRPSDHFLLFQHTAARRRLVAPIEPPKPKPPVSTHSRPKAAGFLGSSTTAVMVFQHTAARRRLARSRLKTMGGLRFQHTAARRRLGRRAERCMSFRRFQHTAARRRLEPLSKALLHQVSQPRFR